MIFDIKDVKSWATRHDVKVGDEGYFFTNIDDFRDIKIGNFELVTGKLLEVRDDYASCFMIGRDHYGIKAFDFFIPVDKVKAEKVYRPFKDAYELYKFFLPSASITRKDFNNSGLLNFSITCRKRDTRNFTTTELITSVETAVIDNCHLTIVNGKNLEYWFDNYEIMDNYGKWQPFGIVEKGRDEE